ncbi:MAG: hypothetical protein ACRD2J_05620 [Thermoanaerobaculia bacterium]
MSKAAQKFKEYEQIAYSSKAKCEEAAAFYAKYLKEYMTHRASWPDDLIKKYNQAQQDYEDTHHEGICGFVPSLCGAY